MLLCPPDGTYVCISIYLILTKNTRYPIYWFTSKYANSMILAQVLWYYNLNMNKWVIFFFFFSPFFYDFIVRKNIPKWVCHALVRTSSMLLTVAFWGPTTSEWLILLKNEWNIYQNQWMWSPRIMQPWTYCSSVRLLLTTP